MNNYNCIGNLGRDPELKYFDSGSCVARFSLAIRGFKEGETVWIDCEAWNKAAGLISDYCKKGSKVGLSGSLKSEKWTDKETGKERSKLVLNVDRLTLIKGDAPQSTNENEDDIPF